MNTPQVVIIGGGFGGLQAARSLKNAPVDVTLIDRRNHHVFQPLLYQVATGALSPADIATPLRSLLKRQKNARVVLGEVVGFDVENHRVLLADGEVGYDTLIVAAGAGSHYFGSEHWQRWAPSLKSVEDATEMRRRIVSAFEAAERAGNPDAVRAWLTFAVIGGGPTGVELAGALAEVAHETLRNNFRTINPSDARILLVQSGERILPTFDASLSAGADATLRRKGVEIVTNARVTDVTSRGITVSQGNADDFIPARTVLWAAGVKASPLGKALADATGAELDRGGRVVVQPDLSLPGHANIFVVGDLASFAHGLNTPLPGVAQVAIQQGKYVGKSIRFGLQGRSLPAFRYQDRGSLATIGRGAAVAEIGKLRFNGLLAWQLWLVIHLMYLGDAARQILVFLQWLWNYPTGGRMALLITNEPAFDLKRQSQVNPALALETGTMPRAG